MVEEAPTIAQRIDEEERKPEIYIPPDDELNVVKRVFELFSQTAQDRNRSFEYFDNRNLIEYIQDNVKQFITNIYQRDNIEDWQARIFDPFTRNKVIGVLAKVAQFIPVPEFIARGDEDVMRERIITDLFRYADDVDDAEELMFFALLEALVKGTCIGYEGYIEKEKKIRNVGDYSGGDDIQIKEGKMTIRKVYSSIVPLEDFYPSSVGIRRIKDMPYCFWRQVMPLSKFQMEFSQFDKAKYVQPFKQFGKDEEKPFYLDYVSSGLKEGEVEVIRYYNQDTDEFIIIANGIWLNPLPGNKVSPIPFNHKSLPFWKAFYEPLGSDFFYGKALPDKLKPLQEALNVLHNMLLDQSFLSIFPPILVQGIDDIEDDYLRPGRRIEVMDVNAYKELQISPPSGFHQYILEYTKRVLEETSIDPVQQGVSGTRERVTATEIERAAQAVMGIIGLFQTFIKWGVRDRARLRVKNILQFYKKPLIEKVLGEGGTERFNKAFNTFRVDDTILSSGKRGTKIIEMYRKKLPSRVDLRARALALEKERGRKVEIVSILPEYLRDIEVDIVLRPNPKAQMSKAMEIALLLELGRYLMEFVPDVVDRKEIAVELIEAFGKNPERLLNPDIFQQQEEKRQTEEEVVQSQQAGRSTGSTGLTENMVNALLGRQRGTLPIRDLINEGR